MRHQSQRPSDPAVEARERGRVVGHKAALLSSAAEPGRPQQPRGPPDDDEADATSIATFCRRHNISESFYFKLRLQGLGPQEIKIGARTLISKEAAARWRAEREAKGA
jgi:hypothetical protein